MQLTVLDGDSWTKRTARSGFPILVEYARNRREITYGEWDNEMVRRGLGSHVVAVQYGSVAGRIGDACEAYAAMTGVRVPPINLMVVNQETRIPGSGAHQYFRRFCSDFLAPDVNPDQLSMRDQRALIDQAQEKIFDFSSWGDVLAACGLADTKPPPDGWKRHLARQFEWATGPESDEHKRLKRQVAEDPALVGLKTDENGVQEHLLWSGDRVDVYFKRAAVGVEVKTANASIDEIRRGIFQCVKYKAVLRAQQIHEGRIPTADCLLALGGTLPADLREIVTLFGVRCHAQLAE